MGTPPLVARGRSADVWADGPDRVWRRYRDGHDAAGEVALMAHLASHGYPVPPVYAASGPAMLLGRVPGPTLSQYLAERPWRMNWAAHILRSLLDRLATVPPAPGLPRLFGAGEAILHLDLHPGNVLLGPSGPVVIDWPNAALGPPAADVAQSWLLLDTSQIPSPTAVRPVVRAGQRLLARRLLPRHDPARHWIPAVAAHRITDINLTEIERRRVARLKGPVREPQTATRPDSRPPHTFSADP